MKKSLRSWRSVVGVGVALSAVLAGPTVTAVAEPVAAGQADHQMGASIRAHEGVQEGHGIAPAATQTPGLDVSHWQGTIDWASVRSKGAKFAYIKATEG